MANFVAWLYEAWKTLTLNNTTRFTDFKLILIGSFSHVHMCIMYFVHLSHILKSTYCSTKCSVNPPYNCDLEIILLLLTTIAYIHTKWKD